jgi:hypothetical protein
MALCDPDPPWNVQSRSVEPMRSSADSHMVDCTSNYSAFAPGSS